MLCLPNWLRTILCCCFGFEKAQNESDGNKVLPLLVNEEPTEREALEQPAGEIEEVADDDHEEVSYGPATRARARGLAFVGAPTMFAGGIGTTGGRSAGALGDAVVTNFHFEPIREHRPIGGIQIPGGPKPRPTEAKPPTKPR